MKRHTRKAAILKLIFDLGGEATREQINARLSEYWKLSEEDRQIEEGVGKPKFWHRSASVCQALKDRDGYLENPDRGIWKITEKGKKGLAKYGLQDKPFSDSITEQPSKQEIIIDHLDLITQVISELLPDGVKKFPDDFLDSKEKIKFREINVPGTILQLDPYSRDIVISPKGYFRYKAKNPPEAVYILYSNHIRQKSIKVPEDNLTVFKSVKSYEKYIKD